MAIKWSVLSEYILNGILKDPEGETFEAPQMLAWARWSLLAISAHTAETAFIEYSCDGQTYQFPLPDDMIGSLENSGLVAWINSADTSTLDIPKDVEYVPPIRLTSSIRWPVKPPAAGDYQQSIGYWEWPTGRLTLTTIPSAGDKIVVNYFKTWTPPTDGDSRIDLPIWLEPAFAYLVAAHACDPTSMQFSGINNWKRKTDAGQPEQNPRSKQALYFLKRAEDEMAKFPPQDRSNFYRVGPRDSSIYE